MKYIRYSVTQLLMIFIICVCNCNANENNYINTIENGINWLITHKTDDNAWVPHTVTVDNAWAIRALVASGDNSSTKLSLLVNRLKDLQHSDGSWDHGIIPTSLSIIALIESGDNINELHIQNAINWLKNKLNFSDYEKGNTSETAYSIIALIKSGEPKTSNIIVDGVNWLKHNINDDGGWGSLPKSISYTWFYEPIIALALADGLNSSEIQKAINYRYSKNHSNHFFLINSLNVYIYTRDNKLNTIEKVKNIQQNDGGWKEDSFLSVNNVTTSKAVYALCKANYEGEKIINAVKWIEKHITDEGDYIGQYKNVNASYIAISAIASANMGYTELINKVTDQYISNQNTGWHYWFYYSIYEGMTSNTSNVIRMLHNTNKLDTTQIEGAINQLTSKQNSDGGWSSWLNKNKDYDISDISNTSNALLALSLMNYDLTNTTISKGINYLTSKFEELTINQLCTVVLLLHNFKYDETVIDNLVGILLEKQNIDGSWNNLIHETSNAIITLSEFGNKHNSTIAKSVSWLKASQNKDGGWSSLPGIPSSNTVNTGLAVWALSLFDEYEFIKEIAINSEIYCPGDTIQLTLSVLSEASNITATITDPSKNIDYLDLQYNHNNSIYTSSYLSPHDMEPGTHIITIQLLNPSAELIVSTKIVNVLPPHTLYYDSDSDGFGDNSIRIISCSLLDNYVVNNFDCNDSDANINPNEIEYVDGIDNDCDGFVDEGDKCLDQIMQYDPNGDGIIGLEEIIYYLKIIAGFNNSLE